MVKNPIPYTAISLTLLLLLNSFPQQGIEAKEKTNKLPELHALVPSLDTAKPITLSRMNLRGTVEDSYNPSMVAIPRTGSTQAYQAGRKLYKQGDYQRAMTAFQMALEQAKKYGTEDQRYKSAKQAIESTGKLLTQRKKLGFDTDSLDKNALTGKVTQVYIPSLAWLGGLKKDDLIVQSKSDADKVSLTVKRSGRLYGLTLRIRPQTLVQQRAIYDNGIQTGSSSGTTDGYLSGKIAHPELLVTGEKRLASYDCILMLDCSGSMGDRIVSPGRQNGALMTRWNWCKNEMLNFWGKGSPYFPEGITLIPFANNFAIVNEARAPAINKLFNQLSPLGGTNMAKPLSFLFNDYFQRKARAKGKVKPLVIAILSDGEGNAHALSQLIIKTTHRMQYRGEILITFLAVDATEQGRPVIEALDNGLYQAGAKYDIVDSRTFSELQQYGLLKMVVAALLEKQVE